MGAALRASHKTTGQKGGNNNSKDNKNNNKDNNHDDEKELLEMCFAWIDGKSVKEAKVTLGDIKRRNKMIFSAYVGEMDEWRNTDEHEKERDEKENHKSDCHEGCGACKYVRACKENEKERIRKVNAERKIDK